MARTFLNSTAALILCAIATAGCIGSQPETQAQAPSTPETSAPVADAAPVPEAMGDSSTESEAADSLQASEQAPRVRAAVREFIAEAYPKSEVEGIWLLPMRGNYCIAGADTVVSSRHRNIDVLARQYVREDGSSYWRCEGFGPGSAALLLSRSANANSPDNGS